MSWSQLSGHDALVTSFRHVLERQRLAHAYLFVGPSGVGKRLFAFELAKALLCETNPPERLEACEHCESCALVNAGTHPDLFTVARPEDKNEFPIALMQELCRDFSMKPARNRGKIGILDDADDLNEESANSFLKTLEEPPPRSLFILVGKGIDRQLPTILSRCHIVRFAPLGPAHMAEILRKNGHADPAQIAHLVKLAEGSPGQALALADPALWDFREVLLGGLAIPGFDATQLARRFIEFVEEAGKDGSAQRRRAGLMLRLLVQALRDALAASLGTASNDAIARTLATRAGTDKILAMIERCLETENHIDRYVQLTLVLEALLDALGQLLDPVAV